MWIGWIEFDLLLADVRSLKQKRSVVRPMLAQVRRHLDVSVAEVDHLELHRRTGIGAAVVAVDRSHVVSVLDAIEELVATRPEIDLLSARRGLRHSDD
ncbi:MAG: DUF503 domain-containing protein [Nocardioidaceae bacterium]|nr:DUF503 domain-containing protein [Nocardioidaceae bacterium]